MLFRSPNLNLALSVDKTYTGERRIYVSLNGSTMAGIEEKYFAEFETFLKKSVKLIEKTRKVKKKK